MCGTEDFVEREVGKIITKARAYIARLQLLLLPNHDEEYLAVVRTTLPGRFQHVCKAVVPRRVCLLAAQFDELQISAFSAAVGQLTSTDIPDVRDAIMLQLGAGGRGFRPMAEDCYGLFDGAWAQSAHRHRRHLPVLA